MQRTRPADVAQLSDESANDALAGEEVDMATARSSLAPSSGRAASGALSTNAYLNSPRGQLLRSLAADASAAQAERRASRLAPAPRSYEEVLAEVEAALMQGQAGSGLSSDGSSRIPRPTQQQQQAAPKRQAYLSPSRIPKAGALVLPAAPADENALASAPSSPDKPAATGAGRALASHPLRASQDNVALR